MTISSPRNFCRTSPARDPLESSPRMSLHRRTENLARAILSERAQSSLLHIPKPPPRIAEQLELPTERFFSFPEIDVKGITRQMRSPRQQGLPRKNEETSPWRMRDKKVLEGSSTQYVKGEPYQYGVLIHLTKEEARMPFVDIFTQQEFSPSEEKIPLEKKREYVLGVCKKKLDRIVYLSSHMASAEDHFHFSRLASEAYQELEKTKGDVSRAGALAIAGVREEIARVISFRKLRTSSAPQGSTERTKYAGNAK